MKGRSGKPRRSRPSSQAENHLDTIIDQFDLYGRKWLIRGLFIQIWGNGDWPSEKEFLEFADTIAIETLNVLEMAKKTPLLEAQDVKLPDRD